MIRDNGQEAVGKNISLVMNWFDDLRRRFASKTP